MPAIKREHPEEEVPNLTDIPAATSLTAAPRGSFMPRHPDDHEFPRGFTIPSPSKIQKCIDGPIGELLDPIKEDDTDTEDNKRARLHDTWKRYTGAILQHLAGHVCATASPYAPPNSPIIIIVKADDFEMRAEVMPRTSTAFARLPARQPPAKKRKVTARADAKPPKRPDLRNRLLAAPAQPNTNPVSNNSLTGPRAAGHGTDHRAALPEMAPQPLGQAGAPNSASQGAEGPCILRDHRDFRFDTSFQILDRNVESFALLQGPGSNLKQVYLCHGVAVDEIGAKRPDTLLSLLDLFGRDTKLCVKTAWGGETGFVMATPASPSYLGRFSFSIRSRQAPGEKLTLRFLPLDVTETSCVVCHSPDHDTSKCPRFVPVILSTPAGFHPQFEAEMLESADPGKAKLGTGGHPRELSKDDVTHRLRIPLDVDADSTGGIRESSKVDTDEGDDGSHVLNLLERSIQEQIDNAGDSTALARVKTEPGAEERVVAPGVPNYQLVRDHSANVDACGCLQGGSLTKAPEIKKADSKLMLDAQYDVGSEAERRNLANVITASVQRTCGRKTGFQHAKVFPSGLAVAMFSRPEMVDKFAGTVVKVHGTPSKLIKVDAQPRRSFYAEQVPFGTRGVGASALLHSLLHLLRDRGRFCVQIAKVPDGGDSQHWTGAVVVTFAEPQPLFSFGFRLHYQSSAELTENVWFKHPKTAANCEICQSAGHDTEKCPLWIVHALELPNVPNGVHPGFLLAKPSP